MCSNEARKMIRRNNLTIYVISLFIQLPLLLWVSIPFSGTKEFGSQCIHRVLGCKQRNEIPLELQTKILIN